MEADAGEKIEARARVGVATLASPLEVGAADAAALLERAEKLLARAGVATVRLGTIGSVGNDSVGDAIVDGASAGKLAAREGVTTYLLVPVSWFEDYLVLDLLEEWSAPLFLWPRPGVETGALCGAQQLAWFLKRLGASYGYAFGPLESQSCIARALTFVRAGALKCTLRRARIGVAGQRVAGMTHTAPDEARLKRVLGPRMVPIELHALIERAAAIPPKKTTSLWAETKSRAGHVRVADEVGREAVAFYLALKAQVDALGLQAVTVGCYPTLMGRPCLAASLLADRGVPLACEGDVHGAVAMLVLSLLSGRPVHSTDWLEPLSDDTIVFAHCGSGSFSLADRARSITLEPVRLMNRGVCVLFPAGTGPVTLLSINSIDGGYQIACIEGEAVATDMVFPGNPVKIRFSRKPAELIDFVFREGTGHHWAVGYGRHAEVVREWVRMLPGGARFVSPETAA